jgi:hypothetical protein
MTIPEPDGSRPDTPVDRDVFLDVLRSRRGWTYVVSGAVTASGRRPTRRWAKRAGKRAIRLATQQR